MLSFLVHCDLLTILSKFFFNTVKKNPKNNVYLIVGECSLHHKRGGDRMLFEVIKVLPELFFYTIVLNIVCVRFNLINSIHNFIELQSQNQHTLYVYSLSVLLVLLLLTKTPFKHIVAGTSLGFFSTMFLFLVTFFIFYFFTFLSCKIVFVFFLPTIKTLVFSNPFYKNVFLVAVVVIISVWFIGSIFKVVRVGKVLLPTKGCNSIFTVRLNKIPITVSLYFFLTFLSLFITTPLLFTNTRPPMFLFIQVYVFCILFLTIFLYRCSHNTKHIHICIVIYFSLCLDQVYVFLNDTHTTFILGDIQNICKNTTIYYNTLKASEAVGSVWQVYEVSNGFW